MVIYWLNVDVPTKNCRLHHDDCKWARGKFATTLKGIGELRQDGGRLEFCSVKAAEDCYRTKYENRIGYEFAICKGCL